MLGVINSLPRETYDDRERIVALWNILAEMEGVIGRFAILSNAMSNFAQFRKSSNILAQASGKPKMEFIEKEKWTLLENTARQILEQLGIQIVQITQAPQTKH